MRAGLPLVLHVSVLPTPEHPCESALGPHGAGIDHKGWAEQVDKRQWENQGETGFSGDVGWGLEG